MTTIVVTSASVRLKKRCALSTRPSLRSRLFTPGLQLHISLGRDQMMTRNAPLMHEANPQRETLSFRSARIAPTVADTRLAASQFLSSEERRILGETGLLTRSVRAGKELVRETEPSANLYFLASGWACRFKITREGGRQISTLLAANDICNLDGLLFERLDYGVRMLTDGIVFALPREQALALADHPGIARSFTWLGFVENAILAQWALCLGRQSARERVAHLLCEASIRAGCTESEGEISFDLPLTQEHIADVLGLTAVHVNRTLHQLRAEGLLRSTTRTIIIPDIARLRRAADFKPAYLHIEDGQIGPVTSPSARPDEPTRRHSFVESC